VALKRLGIGIGIVLCLTASQAGAEGLYFDVAGFTSSIDSGAALREGVGERGWGFLAGGAYRLSPNLALGAELGGQYVKDEDVFTQQTTGGRRSSTTTLIEFAPYLGVRLPAGDRLQIGVNGGYGVLFARRTIENCSNCFTEDLDLDGGLYVEPMLLFGARDSLQFGATFRLYLGGDLKNYIGIRVVFP
jgi:hypothetical protein